MERSLWEGLGLDGRTILLLILNKYNVNTRNWVDSAYDRDYWRALVNNDVGGGESFTVRKIRWAVHVARIEEGRSALGKYNRVRYREETSRKA